jgi:hypothetical protein
MLQNGSTFVAPPRLASRGASALKAVDHAVSVRVRPGRFADVRRSEFWMTCDTLVTLRPFSSFGGPPGIVKHLLDRVPPAGFEPAAFCSGGRRSIP